jgi:hypothetical protein
MKLLKSLLALLVILPQAAVHADPHCHFNGKSVARGAARFPAGSSCRAELRQCFQNQLSGTLSAAACEIIPPQQDLVASQIAPATVQLSMGALTDILNQRAPHDVYTDLYALTSRDQTGQRVAMDCLKIVETRDPAHPYLAVFHHLIGHAMFESLLAYSKDLRDWRTIGRIDWPSAQPTLALLPDDAVLVATERNPSGTRPYIQVRYYANIASLIAAPHHPANAVDLPGSANASADGTPKFAGIRYNGDINQSSHTTITRILGSTSRQSACSSISGTGSAVRTSP